jgi:hypothetical protein
MRIISLKCDHCGAPLDIPAEREQFNCDYCGSGLHIAQAGRTPQEAKGDGTAKPVSEREQKLESELRQLDAEWEDYRTKYLPRSDSGEYFVPEPEACRMGAWLTGFLSGGAAIMGAVAGAISIMVIAAIAGIIVVTILLRQAKLGVVYQRSVENYRRSRQAIVDQLQSDR